MDRPDAETSQVDVSVGCATARTQIGEGFFDSKGWPFIADREQYNPDGRRGEVEHVWWHGGQWCLFGWGLFR